MENDRLKKKIFDLLDWPGSGKLSGIQIKAAEKALGWQLEDGTDFENFKGKESEEVLKKGLERLQKIMEIPAFEVARVLEKVKESLEGQLRKDVEGCIEKLFSRYCGCKSETRKNERILGLDNLVSDKLADFDSFNHDIFDHKLEDITLKIYSHKAFQTWGLFQKLNINIEKFTDYIDEISAGYNDLPYHNSVHAADVMQACHVFLTDSQILNQSSVKPIHAGCLLFSALVHDYKHPGVNNQFLTITKNKLALKYNDLSVLENFHISEAFKLSTQENLNIFEGFSNENFSIFRKLAINLVISTDMSKHQKHIEDLQLNLHKIDSCSKAAEVVLMGFIHLADISNTLREFEVSEKWAVRVNNEFFLQGDQERENGLNVSVNCDRYKVNIAVNQIGFINNLLVPLITPICREMKGMKYLFVRARKNTEIWSQKIEENKPENRLV